MTIPVVHRAPSNPRAARENRKLFDAAGVICLNLIGATGSGKTALLETVLPRITRDLKVGVIKADLAVTCDAQRIGALGVPVVQVLTDGGPHLQAHQVRHAVGELPLADLDLLIIENVGGLIAQAQTDLGEHLRVAVLSVSGGSVVAAKYPQVYRTAALIVLTKYDLLPHVDFDAEGTKRLLARINPTAEVICTATRTRLGVDRLAGWLLGYVRAQRMKRWSIGPASTAAVLARRW